MSTMKFFKNPTMKEILSILNIRTPNRDFDNNGYQMSIRYIYKNNDLYVFGSLLLHHQVLEVLKKINVKTFGQIFIKYNKVDWTKDGPIPATTFKKYNDIFEAIRKKI